MKIHQLELRNFRCFEHRIFNFPDQFAVIIGENTTGKTTILEALVIGAGSFVIGFDNFKATICHFNKELANNLWSFFRLSLP